MCFYSDAAEARLEGQLVRLVFCVDGDPVCQVAMKTGDMDVMIADYLAQRAKRDGRAVNVIAFPAPDLLHADTA